MRTAPELEDVWYSIWSFASIGRPVAAPLSGMCYQFNLEKHSRTFPSGLHGWGPKPLRVGFLMRMEMANCQLAYLSASQTAVNRDEQLVEEGLHLSGAFQMAGVPNTVATAWNIEDEEAVKVATGFYQGLKDEGGRIDVGRSARSLHCVLRRMRDSRLSPFTRGEYMHLGARIMLFQPECLPFFT